MLLYTLVQVLNDVIWFVQSIVIVQFVMSLLLGFNVLDRRNDMVMGIYRGLNALLDPILAPIRRAMPNTGAVDFSPMVLIFALSILSRVLGAIALSGY